jgi:glycogen synthase
VPSRFEPCGLTQLCALRYGAIPVVSEVGGLADTVTDTEEIGAATGFKFKPVTSQALAGALHRASYLWRDQQAWRRLQYNGMMTDVSWRHQAAVTPICIAMSSRAAREFSTTAQPQFQTARSASASSKAQSRRH